MERASADCAGFVSVVVIVVVALLALLLGLDTLEGGLSEAAGDAGEAVAAHVERAAVAVGLADEHVVEADVDDLAAVGIDPGLRPEQVSIADYVRLGNYLQQKSR